MPLPDADRQALVEQLIRHHVPVGNLAREDRKGDAERKPESQNPSARFEPRTRHGGEANDHRTFSAADADCRLAPGAESRPGVIPGTGFNRDVEATWDATVGPVAPKSAAGIRRVPIPATLAAYLDARPRARHRTHSLDLRPDGVGPAHRHAPARPRLSSPPQVSARLGFESLRPCCPNR